jgi:hypothetical protein
MRLVRVLVEKRVARFVMVLVVAVGLMSGGAGRVAAQSGAGDSPPATPIAPTPMPGPGLPSLPAGVLSMAMTVAAVIPQVVTLLLSLLVELVPSLAERWDALPGDLKRAWRAWAAAGITVLTGGALFFLGYGDGQLLTALGLGWVMAIVGAEKVHELLTPWLPRKQPDEDEGDDG